MAEWNLDARKRKKEKGVKMTQEDKGNSSEIASSRVTFVAGWRRCRCRGL